MPTKLRKSSDTPGALTKGEMSVDDRNEEMPIPKMKSEDVKNGMPIGGMGNNPKVGPMPQPSVGKLGTLKSDSMPRPTGIEKDENTLQQVVVECRSDTSTKVSLAAYAMSLGIPGLDPNFAPVPMSKTTADHQAVTQETATFIVRARVNHEQRQSLEKHPAVVRVWNDTKIAHFGSRAEAPALFVETPTRSSDSQSMPQLGEGFATCPIGTCDCSPQTPHGTIADVASYLGADQIWASGLRGEGIVVGVVDGGITALGRSPKTGETARIPNVIGGYPVADWGTTAAAWGDHGNMCATDVLGMAPNANIYDLRISDGNFLSDALAAYQWAIDQHRADGTPQVLTNSFGIFQEGWDPDYARNPNHFFTQKVIEAINEGIIVLFAAGNCGDTCPDGRCGADVGTGRSIWGANSHPQVITVGAVNRDEQFVGYSSRGPGALDPNKPDFCSITHFTGYFTSDSGTSAATPIAAGVAALLKQASPNITQATLKNALTSTTKDIGASGWDQHSGFGILQAKAAFDSVVIPRAWHDWESLGGFCTEGVAVSSWVTGRLDCFVIGSDHQLWHKWFEGSWSEWEPLGGWLDSAPTAVSWGTGRIDVFAIGADHAMWHKWYDGGWSDWESLGGFCTEGVAVSSWAAGRLDCFVIGSDHQLWHKWFEGSWSEWEPLGGWLDSAPTAVSWGADRIDVFAIGGDHAMWHQWWG